MRIQGITSDSNSHLLSENERFSVKLINNESELNQARKLRIKYFSNHTIKKHKSAEAKKNETSVTKKLIEHHKLMVHDGYDSYAQHLVVEDLKTKKIIAYVRIIDAFTAFKIGGFYSETQFNINKILSDQQYNMEISRLSIHDDYDNELTARLIWSGLTQYATNNGFDAIIGSLSLPLGENLSGVTQTISRYKTQHMSQSQFRVLPYQLLPDNKLLTPLKFNKNEIKYPCVDYLFSNGVSLCGDAHWNKTSNTAELFIHYNISNTQSVPHCIHMSEVELGLLCNL
ncbi:MAG: GNAT family N-acetyltransferase [Gammaproteobacteria bacterium]|nr:GNAT family N-acetyltransferase [Gammaproteobacteria bacterium]